LVFLDFPRFIEDPDYLFRKLEPHLPKSCTAARAAAAHHQLADAMKVRTARELEETSGQPETSRQSRATSIQYPSMHNLNCAALQRSQRNTTAPASFARRLARRLRRMVG
jgi:hypothetical protein